jgi:hypothetical protein
MNKIWLAVLATALAVILSACGTPLPVITPSNTPDPTSTDTPVPPTPSQTPSPTLTAVPQVDATTPCTGAPAPAQWRHIVVLMFENKTYNKIVGVAPYITSLVNKCGTYEHWMDADYRVDGSSDGSYHSKPSYATLTNGLSPSVHGLLDDSPETKTDVDNIYHQLMVAEKSFKDYYEGGPGGCGVKFSGDYHDPIRYYSDVTAICDAHDVPLSTFMADVNSGNLPAFSMILPAKDHSMHSNSISSGDAYAQTILDPLLNSQAYAKGDVAIFFLWDEDSPIPNVLLAPSIVPGSQISVSGPNPVSHFSALRTWEEMLDLPLLGDTKLAPSLLPFFGSS